MVGGFGVSQHHNYILMEVCLPTTLSRHFTLRLKQYLLFLEVTNDLELVQLTLSFLSLKDLLNFLALSTHFAALKRLQSVELRILRAKLAHLEKPDEPVAWIPFLHLLPIKLDPSQAKPHKMDEGQKGLIKFLKDVRYFKEAKRQSRQDGEKPKLKVRQRKGYAQLTNFKQELDAEGKRLEEKLKQQAEGWGKLSQKSQNQYVFKQYRDHIHSHSQKPLPPAKKPLANPKTSPTSPLDLLEHHHARIDYERRKARKLQEKEDFIPVEQFKRLAEQDPCSREVFNSIYEQERAREQQRNVAKLRMGPSPDPSKIQLQAVEVKVKKQSIAGKMFSGIKGLLTIDGTS